MLDLLVPPFIAITGPLLVAVVHITPSTQVHDLGLVVDSEFARQPCHVSLLLPHPTAPSNASVRRSLSNRSCELSFTADSTTATVFWRTLRLDCTTNCSLWCDPPLVLCWDCRLVIASVSSCETDCTGCRSHRVTLKPCMMAYKSQHGLLPPYLNRMCTGTGTVPARGLYAALGCVRSRDCSGS